MKHSKAGFTLIEIVMVLVLLGILAAVAVPKYFDLQEKAEIQAAKAMVAEVQARINGEFADQVLNENKKCSDALTTVKANLKKIQATSGFSISVAENADANGLYVVTVSKGTFAYKEGKVAIPTCNNK